MMAKVGAAIPFLAMLSLCNLLANPRKTSPGLVHASQLVEIPAGDFTMGVDRESAVRPWMVMMADCPAHSVYLPDYWISKLEVTRGEINAFRGKLNSMKAKDGGPVEYLRWPEAYDYCRWLGGHLPT